MLKKLQNFNVKAGSVELNIEMSKFIKLPFASSKFINNVKTNEIFSTELSISEER